MANISKITKVRSLRASAEFWEGVSAVAKAENTDINKLIVRVVDKYCKEVNNGKNN